MKVPEISSTQKWVCANGCGDCTVKSVERVFSETRDRLTGEILEPELGKTDVSGCCEAELLLWDDAVDNFVEFDYV